MGRSLGRPGPSRAGRPRRRRARALDLVVPATVWLIVTGCASTPDGAEGETPSRDRHSITEEELRDLPGTNLYDALQRARPLWLTTSGSRSRSVNVRSMVIVVTDGRYFGGIESLRRLPVAGVRRIRYLTGTEASSTYSGISLGGHVEAAIVVEYGNSG